jgi:predicted O-methyltransferase YrrM
MIKWKHQWQTLESGTPIIPYAHLYFKYAKKVLELSPNAKIVELGVYDGCSARIFAETKAQYPSSSLFLIDPNKRPLVEELCHMQNQGVFFWENKAEDMVDRFEDGSIDLLHIDIDGEPAHNYDIQLLMHNLYVPKLVRGGVLIVHDFTEAYGCWEYGNEYIVNNKEEWETYIPPKHMDSPTTRPLIAIKL